MPAAMSHATARDEPDSVAFMNLTRFAVPSIRRSVFQLVTTSGGYIAGWMTMLWLTDINYWLVLALSIPVAGLLVRLFIIFHDCGHGSFFRSRRANAITGRTLGVLTLTPYDAWRRRHAAHHAGTGNLDGDRSLGTFQTWTVEEFHSRRWYQRLFYRCYRHPLVLFGFGAVFYFAIAQRFPQNVPGSHQKAERRSVLGTDLAIGAVVLAMSLLVGWRRFLLVQTPLIIITSVVGMWLFFVQHQFHDAYWERQASWRFHSAALYGSSFYDLPRFLHWFTGNIGFHHIHHINSRIPNYRLPECMEESGRLLALAPRLTLTGSFRCARLALWDESRRLLVSFKDATLRASA